MKPHFFSHSTFVLLPTLLLVPGCGSKDIGPTSDVNFYALAKTRWQNPVPVCFEKNSQRYPGASEIIKNRVIKEYSRTNVRFTGWNMCAPREPSIRIGITNTWPHTKGIGTQLKGMKNGVELAVDFSKPLKHPYGKTTFWPSCIRSEQARLRCIELTAIHEMGHALGLVHEQNRSGTPEPCKKKAIGINGDTEIGAWDANSIMNYCNPKWLNGGVLSQHDIEGLAKLYPLQ
jgi:hypothetical protein